MNKRIIAQIIALVLLVFGNLYLHTLLVKADSNLQLEEIGHLIIIRKAPAERNFREKLWVVIQIENTSTDPIEFQFIEKIGNADFDKTQAHATLVNDPGYGQDLNPLPTEGITIWTYNWKVKLEGGKKTALAYWLVPLKTGRYVISPAIILMDGETYKTTSWTIEIRCIGDQVCATNDGENVLSCPSDCKSGSSDSICDGIQDGIIDPDCEAGYDIDQEKSANLIKTPYPLLNEPTQSTEVKLPPICMGATLTIIGPFIFLFLRSWRVQ